MNDEPLDPLDKRIIHALQCDARKTSASDVAGNVGVSASTVRNRIRKLEDAGILMGYRPEVNYEKAGYQLRTLIVCTAPIPEREELARDALEVPGVVAVREITTGTENVHVEAIGTDGDDLSRIGQDLDALGLEVVDEDLIRNEYEHQFHEFDVDV
ncbi:transcriptional regulator, AsnC family [Halomicrobium zhouii]|uniref:Transcriptional regulator, AsnC family n=1 Tax=Halomicrobium zhouii TaxID=767519 RepID=A0A1I6LGN2_9EURY|nr:Lrp/AsnC family transcriptional regulator [Halomicrobium zhouii]SFS02480.1 transcriptional regulator, AsnC family [Halomicrobium zhouii]